jgi:periplasmic mercuric ion binding protein
MRYIAILTAFVIAIYSLSIAFANEGDSSTSKTNNYAILVFDVANMTCKMCDITVKKAIEQVEGVKRVVVDYDKKLATIVLNKTVSQVPSESSIKAIELATLNVGYPATFKTEKDN